MDNKTILLDYLKKHKRIFLSAKKLADYLNVTERTIRSYIKTINEEHPGTVKSSKNGYKMGVDISKDFNEKQRGSHVNNRRFYILRRLIKSSERGLDLFDLADTLYVSDATIRSDVVNLNKKIRKSNLQIVQEKDRYFLNGEEKDHRKLMVDLIDNAKPTNVSLEEEIQFFLGDIPLQKLKDISSEVFNRYNIKLNTYTFSNFILHLVVSLDRVSKSKQLNENVSSINEVNSEKLQIINEIESELHQLFNIQFSRSDKEELIHLFDIQSEEDDLFVDNRVTKAVEHALRELRNTYMIEFDNKEFKRRLTVHIQHLYNRLVRNNYTRNLNVLNIRVNYPIVFDIAVYLSSVISNDLNIKINDDEIAFIALHIGAYLNNYPDNDESEDKIQTVIITPSYLLQQKELNDEIERYFSEDIIIIGVFDSYDEAIKSMPSSFEMLITTVDIDKIEENLNYKSIEIIKVREFITKYDLSLIENGIKKIKQNRYSTMLKRELPKLIKREFVINSEDSSKFSIMETISNVFIQNKYTDEQYLKKLKEREKASSTAFPSGVAIPHPMHYEGKRTGIIILKPKNKVLWGDIKVKLILGISVNEKDTVLFNLIFPRIIEVLSEQHNVNYLKSKKTRHEIIYSLITLMTEDNYFSE